MINNILGKKKTGSGKRMKPLGLGMGTFKSIKGASLKMQSQWRNMTPRMQNINRMLFKDSDGDCVPDKWDCQPFNPWKQDVKYNVPRWLLNQLNEYDKDDARRMLFVEKKNIGEVAKHFGLKHPLEGVIQKPMVRMTNEEMIDGLRRLGNELGRTPTTMDASNDLRIPAGTTYSRKFGSFITALKLAGFNTNTAPYKKYEINEYKVKDGKEISKNKLVGSRYKLQINDPELREKLLSQRKTHYEKQNSKKQNRSEYFKQPEIKLKAKEYRARPEVQKKKHEYNKEYFNRNKKKILEYQKNPKFRENDRLYNKFKYWLKKLNLWDNIPPEEKAYLFDIFKENEYNFLNVLKQKYNQNFEQNSNYELEKYYDDEELDNKLEEELDNELEEELDNELEEENKTKNNFFNKLNFFKN